MANGDAKASTSKAVPAKSNGKKVLAELEPDSDDDDNDDDEDSDDDAEVDENFRNELLAALQADGVADAFDAAEENDDESEEELLDDEQMMALDDKLADIFRLQGGGKKGKKGAFRLRHRSKLKLTHSPSAVERTDDLHYRLRVVDLIESLAKQRSANPHLVLVLLPLFSIVRGSATVEQELQSKAGKLLRQIVSGRKDSPAPADPQSALEALEELHTVSQTVDSADLATLCSQTSIYLAKAALASPVADAQTSAAIAKLFGDSFELYLSKKNSKTRVQPALTVEFGRRLPACAWPLFKTVVALAGGAETAVNAYRRMQAFEVAQALLTSYAALVRPFPFSSRPQR